MSKIAIIGGGISGLALLHYLKQRYPVADITLYERKSETGGNIQSVAGEGFLFETGPNGFLNNSPATFEFISQLGLDDELACARSQHLPRYIQIKGQLLPVPRDMFQFMQTSLLSWGEKWMVMKGLFGPKISKNRPIYDYVSARFGRAAAEKLADPFISGIFAGDIKRLHMDHAFPKSKSRVKGQMYTFKKGMGQMICRINELYGPHIKVSTAIHSLKEIAADRIFCSSAAYASAALLADDAAPLAQTLEQIPYAPVVVVGLGFEKAAFKRIPDGFGYLIPSREGKEVLGVLMESNVFERRAPQNAVMVRVMLGGRHHPQIINDDPSELLAKAVAEVDKTYGLAQKPLKHWIKCWPKAIPQYEMEYPAVSARIRKEAAALPHLTLAGNYLNGVSVNECIGSARSIVQALGVFVFCVCVWGCEQKPSVRHYTEVIISSSEKDTAMPAMTGPHAGLGLDLSATAGKIAWDVPAGWRSEPASAMRLATFRLADDPQAMDASIVSLPGGAGGLEANLKRWLGQINLQVSDQELAEFISSSKDQVFDFTRLQTKASGEAKSMLAALVELNEATVFVKLTGSKHVVQKNKNSFLGLVKSIRLK